MGKNIMMQYPCDTTGDNQLFDGDNHLIKPDSLSAVHLRCRDFIIMKYYDITANCNAIALLTPIDNTLANVPLDNYDILFEYMVKNRLQKLDLNKVKLPSKIPLAQTLCADDLFNLRLKNSDSLNFKEYVALDVNNIIGGNYSFNGVQIDSNNEEIYSFNKAPIFVQKDEQINKGIRNYKMTNGNLKYEFAVDVPEGMIGTIKSVNNTGRIKTSEVLIIPGKHIYNITYAHCLNNDDFHSSVYSERLEISGAKFPNYRDVHDSDKAFTNGCHCFLYTTFYGSDGKAISQDDTYISQSKK